MGSTIAAAANALQHNPKLIEAVGNMWENLTELSEKDPERYKELMEESAKENAKLNSAPLPHTCFSVKLCISPSQTSNGKLRNDDIAERSLSAVTYFINIFAWERVPATTKQGSKSNGAGDSRFNDCDAALPMCG